jgi:hypothetical protein
MDVWGEVVRQLGGLPVGSPDEVRARAALAQELSETIEAQARRLAHRVSGTAFQGPAAVRFRADSDAVIGGLRCERDQLAELAAWLRGEACKLEERQDDWRRRADRLAAEIVERARELSER